jgi:hypothetical protein
MPDVHGWPTFTEWRATLTADGISVLDALVERMRAAGANEPESWARSEIKEDIAQAARYGFLRVVWRDLERWRDPAFTSDAVAGIELSESQRQQVIARLAAVAFRSALDVIHVIDNQGDYDGVEGMPGWKLVEIDPDGEPTGRDVDGLHESLLDVDPLRLDAGDFREW